MNMFSSTSPTQACKHQIKSETPDFHNYRHYCGWVNADTIKENGMCTTQWGASVITENDGHLTFKAPCKVAIGCGLAMDLVF